MRSPAPAKITLCSPTTSPPRKIGKADIALAAGADIAVAHAHAVVLERDGPAGSRGLAEKKGRAGGGVALVAVMQLEDLDVEIGAERLGDPIGEPSEQIDAKAHIAGLDDCRVAGGGFDLGLVARPRTRSCR